jgi:uncharacterized protein (DUF697 family)
MEEKKSSEEIIKMHVIFAMTAGAIPIPVADLVAVSAIQYDMIRQLADFHGVDSIQTKGDPCIIDDGGCCGPHRFKYN